MQLTLAIMLLIATSTTGCRKNNSLKPEQMEKQKITEPYQPYLPALMNVTG